MNKLVLVASFFIIGTSMFAMNFPDGTVALGVILALSTVFTLIFRHYTDEKEFIVRVFVIALAARLFFGVIIQLFDLQAFFGGDYIFYHESGISVAKVWWGLNDELDRAIYDQLPLSAAGWGMSYFVGAIYFLIGPNLFASQSICAVIGAAAAPMVYFCTHKVYENKKAAKLAALGVALFPPFVIWGGQLLKDGLIVFMLVAAITMVLDLQKKISIGAILVLVASIFGVFSLRFYVFYMLAIAVAGSFFVGFSANNRSIVRNASILLIVSIGLIYLGVGDRASRELSMFANLERVHMSRLDMARSAGSGFAEELDVSTTYGAIAAVPIGFAYLMFAPFPWQAANIRQAITIPDVLMWWALIPFGVFGFIYSIKQRLRRSMPILLFTLLLTISYSVFQGNVGTAYRQRTQIQIFMFIMIAVGWTLYQEKKENDRITRLAAQRRIAEHIRHGNDRLVSN